MKKLAGLLTFILLAAEVVSAANELAEMEATAVTAALERMELSLTEAPLARMVEKLGGSRESAQITRNQAAFLLPGASKVRVRVSDYLFHRLGKQQIGICYELEGKGVAMTDVPREWGRPFRVEGDGNGHVRFFYARPFPEPASAQAVVSFDRTTQKIDSLIFIFWLRV